MPSSTKRAPRRFLGFEWRLRFGHSTSESEISGDFDSLMGGSRSGSAMRWRIPWGSESDFDRACPRCGARDRSQCEQPDNGEPR